MSMNFSKKLEKMVIFRYAGQKIGQRQNLLFETRQELLIRIQYVNIRREYPGRYWRYLIRNFMVACTRGFR